MTHTISHALSIEDQDFDGVPDAIDQCMHTPFLNQVDETGCTTKILKLPYETETDGLTIALKTGYSTNDDLIGRTNQRTTKIRATYYHNTWSYTLRTGYYIHNQDRGSIDTTFRIKKRIKVSSKMNFNVSATVKLPTYNFAGNKTDYTFAASLSYYPTSSISIFTGAGHTFINDEQIITPLQDTNYFYIGTGYFFTEKLYGNLSYNYAESKFTTEYTAHSLGTTLYYHINKEWFTTLSYSREFDEDLHDVLNFTIGYRVW
jgi:hypothetical protein